MQSIISAQVMVLDTSKDKIWVKASSCDNCDTCNSGGGCRSRLFTMFSSQDKVFKLDVAAKHSYEPGDNLILSCPDVLPLLIMTVLYFVPMIIFVILTAVGHYTLQLAEPWTITLAVAGFLVYYGFLYLVKPVWVWQKLLAFKISKITSNYE
ncbi:MAG: SoxR reducing system RseC family protein [Candidatus Portiera sp.]|nr:SoxR reducing system RseC family protein [Portiera sp.]